MRTIGQQNEKNVVMGLVKTKVKTSVQLFQSVRKNITTQTEKQHEMKDVKMKTVKLI